MILGSGLGDFVNNLKDPTVILYKDIPNWKTGKGVCGHKSRLVIGCLKSNENSWMVIMQGRLHIYEGHKVAEVCFPVRVFHQLKIKNLILTCATGSLNPEYRCGDIILVKDHINQLGVNPLIGTPFKPLFVDMKDCYNEEYRMKFMGLAHKHKIKI